MDYTLYVLLRAALFLFIIFVFMHLIINIHIKDFEMNYSERVLNIELCCSQLKQFNGSRKRIEYESGKGES